MAIAKGYLKPIKTWREISGKKAAKEEEEVVEPLSPAARVFHAPQMNCFIMAEMGCKTTIDVEILKEGAKYTLLKHPRFTAKLVFSAKNGNPIGWVQTKINVDDHIIIPELDPNMDSPDQFVEEYVSNITKTPMDLSKPLWEVHILHIKTSKANSIGVFRIHHSMGDGISLISLVLACTRKSSDLEALPTLPVETKKKPQTTICLKDTNTPVKGLSGCQRTPRRFVHRTFSLDDIKLVKNYMNMTINDVVFGITQAGLSRYLNRNYGKSIAKGGDNGNENNLSEHIRLRATLLVNLRPTPTIEGLAQSMEGKSNTRWQLGNSIGYIVIPFHIALRDDPLDYIRDAKTTIDRKKRSLEAPFTYLVSKLMPKILGLKMIGSLADRVLSNTTLAFSNVVGPMDEISFYGHPLAYLAPSVYGHPQALTVHFQSYMDTMTLVLAIDEDVIPDPHKLCDDIVESLQLVKNATIERKLSKS